MMRMLTGEAAFLFVLALGGCSAQSTGATEPTAIMLTADGAEENDKQQGIKR